MYPSPTDGMVHISSLSARPIDRVVITDLHGNVLKILEDATLLEIDFNQMVSFKLDQPSGIYLLVIDSGDKSLITRVVKR